MIPIPVSTVTVTLSAASLTVNQTSQASATPKDADGAVLTGRTVTWSSSSSTVATVSATGLVTAVSPGTATISGTSEGKTGSATVNVAAAPVAVATVSLSPASGELYLGQQGAFAITVKDVSGNVLTGRVVSWASSAASVASVDAAGLLTAVAVGTSTITATSEGKSATATLTVVPPPAAVATITLQPAAGGLYLGEVGFYWITLKDVAGNTLTDRVVTWSSNLTSVATVAADGLVSGIGLGTATITATSEGKSGSATVTVVARTTPNVAVATVTLTPTSGSLFVGDVGAFTPTVKDASGNVLTNRPVTWSSSQPGVASVRSDGLLTALSPGTTTTTATSEGKSGSAVLTVVARPAAPVNLCTLIGGGRVIASDAQFLGSLTNKYNVESVLNAYGSYGSKYSRTSIYNTFSNYGSPYSSKSAYNPYTSTPPRIFFPDGTYLWLTVNPYLTGVVHPDFVKTCTNFP